MDDEQYNNSGTWIIQTWMGRHVFTDQSFETFDEARGFISERANEEVSAHRANGWITTDAEAERLYDGICEDLYAVRLPEYCVTDIGYNAECGEPAVDYRDGFPVCQLHADRFDALTKLAAEQPDD